MNLNTQIIAYLTVNNIVFSNGDYKTGQPQGQANQILYWNATKLGAQPTQAQLDEATPIYEGQQIAEQNKITATSLLQATDWAATIDISDPQYSNPYLTNQTEFLTYRSTVRAIVVNPPTTTVTFPNKPEAVWSS